MNIISKEYLKSLVPENLPNGMKILEEGIEIGKTIKAGRSKFIKDSEYDTYMEYKKDCINKGKIRYMTLLGLPNMEEQVKGLEELSRFAKENNFDGFTSVIAIGSTLMAVPEELRGDSAASNSFVMDSQEDFDLQQNVAGMEPLYLDHIFGTPAGMDNLIKAIKAGASNVGTTSQMIWRHPGCTDYKQYLIDTVKETGVIASKFDEGVVLHSYHDDGIPGYFSDSMSYVAFMLFEHYIFRLLCGARYVISYGGLLSDVRYRQGIALAIKDLLQTEEEPVFGFIQASTTVQWDHDVNANFGPTLQEMLCEIMCEKKYNLGALVIPISVTEKLHVPTLEVLKDITAATIRLEERVDQWDGLMDFSEIEQIAETMKEKGTEMFKNILNDLEEAGIDIKDPLQLLHVIFNFNPGRFEEAFHPSVRKTGTFTPYYPTDMGLLTEKMTAEEIEKVKEAGLEGSLKGKKVVVASTDSHVYGLTLVKNVYRQMGADVADCGVDATASAIFDMADEEGTNIVAISSHNGQAHGVAEDVLAVAKERGNYNIIMGGVLNAIFQGHTEATDVTDMINEMGICAGNDLVRQVEFIKDCK